MEKNYVLNISLTIFGLIIAFANAQTSTTTQTTTVTYPSISLSCDFEKDFCNWTHYDDADAFKWQRSNGPTLTDLTGPLTDHTTQSLDGSYAYIKTSGIAANSTARIKSAPITVRSYSGFCFSFWYHMWGQAVNTLSLRLERMDDLTNSTIVWSRQTSQGNSWRYAQIAISEAGNFRLVFEGIAGPSDQGDIAVDDFVSKTSLCSATTYCDFETPELCGFYNSPLGIFNWTRYRGATPGFSTGPSFDHTTQTKNGYYMYIDAKYRNEYDYAVLISPGYKYYSSTPRCVEIWYHMYGYDAGTLNIYRMEKEGVSGKYLKVFSISGNQGNEWHILQVNVPINYNKEFFIAIEATVDVYDYYSWGLDGDIAIDDYTIKDSPCPPMGDCTFEDDLCAWKNAEKNVDFEWVRHRGETPSGSGATGPSIDHTYGTDRGTYLFIDTSSPTIKAGGKAQLVSSVFDRYTTRSFEFYYHMNVKNSSLSISRRNFRSTTTAQLWSTSINQGDDWKYGCVSILNNVTSNYVLVIEGVAIGGPNSGDIALDDFKIINGQTCPTEDELCALKCHDTQKCVPLSKVCDFIEDCSGGEDEIGCGYRNVTFESDFGDWQTSEDTFSKWVRARSGNDGEFGPTIDHTTESTSGYFLNLVRNAQAKSSESAVFRSPVMRNTYSVCRMRLWYQLNGRGNGLIDIFINMGTQKSRALRITESTYNEWKEVIVPIGTYRSGFSVSIEANRTYSVIGNIAIDDISFHDCTPTYSPTCFWNQTRCNNSVCISSTSRYCDLVDDCGDFSDEESKRCSAYPFKCDFESGVCQWTPDDSNLFNWQRVKANEATPSLAPGRDHTTNTGSGAYFLIDAKGKPSGAISRIFGPKISSKVNSCRMRFFYYMYGRSVAQLRILSRYEVGGYLSSRWTKVGSVGEFWERGEVTLYPYSSSSPAVQWVIEAQVANVTNVDGIIAIDDITFDPECTIPAGEMPTVFTTTTVPTCGADGYKCPEWNGKCIKKSQLCDFQVDCPNGDDEKNCGICDFENSTCGWYDNSYGDHIWNRTKAGDAGIDKDVLPGTSKGFVIDYETMEGAFNGLTRLYSPILGRTSASCEFEFYYYKKSSPNPRSTSLSLYLENTDLSKERLWRTEDNSVNSDWTRILVNLHSRAAGIRLYFEASHADQIGDNRPIIALDNINFLNCLTVYNTSCNLTNVFTCSASNCIPNSMVCDHSKDCLEGEDEQSCSLYKRCDFESESNSLCDWGEDDDSDLRIKRSKGAAFLSSSLNFPTFDHTTLKSDGFYLHNDLSGGDGKTTRISSPIFYPPSGDKCAFRMWYYMSDNKGTAPALTVYQRTMIGGPMTVLWQKSNLISSDWARTEIILRADRTFQIVVEITNKNAEVAIDDLSFTPECRVNLVDKLPSYIFTTPSPDASCGISNQFRCSTSRECIDMSSLCNFRYECADKSDEAFCPWQCNFDDNTMCSWTNEVKGTNSQPKTKWITASGDISDHTTLSTSGIYLTMDMSGKQPGDMAKLVSPVYNQAGFTCNFEFWLLSLTDQSSKVNVYVRSELTESRVLTVSPSSLGTWKYVSIDLPTCLSQFQIVVEGVIGSTNKSFIALDDFLLVNCEYPKGEAASTTCQIGQFTCASKHCIAQDAICDLSEDCCDASDEKEDLCSAYSRCNFEEDMCGFRNVNEDETKHLWERERADSESTELIDKPLLDHSKQSAKGHYLLLKRNEDSKVGEKASIEIPMKSSDVGCRLRLWYWLSKQFYAELGVFVRESIGERWTNIYQNINPTNRWTRADIEIPAMKNFQLLITGELDKNTEGFLALDDFSFSPECAIDLDLVLPTYEPLTTDPNSFDSTTKGIDKPSTSSDLGLILGIVIPCCILLIAGLVVGGVFFVKKRKSQATNSEEDAKKLPSMDEGPPGLFNKNFNDN